MASPKDFNEQYLGKWPDPGYNLNDVPPSLRNRAERFASSVGRLPHGIGELEGWEHNYADREQEKLNLCPYGYSSQLHSDACANCGRSPEWHLEQGLTEARPKAAVHDDVQEITHILHQGSPICGFSRERPQDWPSGHYWVSMQARVDGAEINCITCAQEFYTLTGRKVR